MHVIPQEEGGAAQNMEPAETGNRSPTLADLMIAINNLRNKLVVKIDSVAIDVNLLRQEL